MSRTRPDTRTRWVTPAVGLGIGIAYLVAGVVAGNVTFGVLGLAIMVATAVGLVVASRYARPSAGCSTDVTSGSPRWTCAPRRSRDAC